MAGATDDRGLGRSSLITNLHNRLGVRTAPWDHVVHEYTVDSAVQQWTRGVLIAFAGLDDILKTTQIDLFSSWLCETYLVPVVSTKLAGSGVWALTKLIQSMEDDQPIPPDMEAVVRCSDALGYYHAVVRPYLEAGCVVTSDGYSYCEEAYLRALGVDMRWPQRILSLVPPADLCFFLDVPLERRRVGPKFVCSQDMGKESIVFQHNLRGQYLTLSRERPEVIVVDASGTTGEIQLRLRSHFITWWAEGDSP